MGLGNSTWNGVTTAGLHHFYDLYLEAEAPSRGLLSTLVMLCEKTARADTAAKFQAE